MSKDAINLHTIDFLLSPRGRAAAQRLADTNLAEDRTLFLLQELRRTFSPSEAGALLALARLRRAARPKFSQAEQLFFTQEALEQATAAPVAAHRAHRIAEHAPPGPVLDLGCGIGGDTLALARHRRVIAYEQDPVRLRFARANLAAQGLADQVQFHHCDWIAKLQSGRLPAAAAAFIDPARRQAGRRLFSLYDIQPPLSVLLQVQSRISALAVKVMPGVQDRELPPGCSVEFISHTGVCKEAILWFGPFVHSGRWASVHRNGQWRSICASGQPPPLGPVEPGMVLHEPDPAVIRAGAFVELSTTLQAHLFDPQIAYLVSSQNQTSHFTRTFALHEIHPFGLKLLNQRLHALDIGFVELKKRGVPFEPESLRPRLRLGNRQRSGVVIFTRHFDRRIMLIAERIT